MFLDAPRGFRDRSKIDARLALLETAKSVQPLRDWAEALVERRSQRQATVVPHFDPAEGGVEARVLLVHEAPGPMTNADNVRPGSGFVSVDNDDKSAETVWKMRDAVGLHTGVLGWNIVPWYLGPASVKPSADELREGGMEMRRLLPLLPELRVVIASGLYAQKGWTRHVAPYIGSDLTVISTWHPSPLAMKQPGKRDELLRAYERAARAIG